jgi:hypothetical protein
MAINPGISGYQLALTKVRNRSEILSVFYTFLMSDGLSFEGTLIVSF